MAKNILYCFGVKMTSLEVMRFNKYLDNNNISMNTYKKEERTQIAKTYLIGAK